MASTYSLIQEPLNLCESGQAWFRDIYDRERRGFLGRGLVLGATPWMGELLAKNHGRVILADMSAAMLEQSRASASLQEGPGEVSFLESNWLNLPPEVGALSTVLGDNSFPFLEFPRDWANLLGSLADRMNADAILIARFFSVPENFRPREVSDLIQDYRGRSAINATQLRSELMFSQWSGECHGIDTAKAIAAFRARREDFEHLLRQHRCEHQNDLVTIEKYQGTGLTLYAHKMSEIAAILQPKFQVRSISYGDYAMAEHFPLIVATRC
jgi:SAM-dependent methyltransferase